MTPANNNEGQIAISDFDKYQTLLKTELAYVEDDTFSWNDVIGMLIIQLKNTDSINKERDASHASQIQITSGKDTESGQSKTDDFFPTLVLNTSFKSWRMSIPLRLSKRNIVALKEESYEAVTGWQEDTIQLRRRLLNKDASGKGNPALQMCYENDLMPLREQLQVGDYLVLVKRQGVPLYEAFGVRKDIDLGKGKNMYKSENATKDDTAFFLPDILSKETNIVATESGDTVAADIRVFEEIPDDLTIDQLGCILAEMYSKAAGNQQVVAIHMFGLKYGKVIIEKGYTAASITRASKINDSYATEVSKGINMYKALSQNKHGMMITYGKCDEQNQVVAVTHKKKALPTRQGRTKNSFSMNSILYGAPGTGKTFSTAEYAIAMVEKKSLDEVRTVYPDRAGLMSKYAEYIEKERVVFTTFHQSYGYEDFVQGLRPDSDSDKLSLIPYDGVLKRIADRAMQDQENDYVIIIDEINRANISKVFGELITLIEEDKRWGELNALSVTLPSGDHFAVPNNLFILGTMNTADKSISLIDTALRRRFEFVEMTPDANKIADPVLKDVFVKLNTGLAKELDGTDLLIGHAYFIGKTAADLCQIMNRSIIPLLYEYFYDSGKKVENQLKNALTGLDVEVTRNPFGRIKLTPKEQ